MRAALLQRNGSIVASVMFVRLSRAGVGVGPKADQLERRASRQDMTLSRDGSYPLAILDKSHFGWREEAEAHKNVRFFI